MSLTYDGITYRSLEEQVRYDAEQVQLLKQEVKKNNVSNLENGTGIGSLVQKRLKSDGVTWTTAKAYQGASTALGGGTQAGRTEEEFNSYFWDNSTNEPINGGKGKNSDGKILDNNGLTYEKSYSFSVAEGENTKALGRSSHSEGNATQAIGDCAHSEGLNTKAEGYAAHTEGAYTEAYYTGSHAEGDHTKTYREYQHVEGAYNFYKSNALFIVGNGTSNNDRKNAFEVLEDGRAKVQKAPIDNDDVVRKGDLANITGGKLYRHTIIKSVNGVNLNLSFLDNENIYFSAASIEANHSGNNIAFVDNINNSSYSGGGGILNAIISQGHLKFVGILCGLSSGVESTFTYYYDAGNMSSFKNGADYIITEV